MISQFPNFTPLDISHNHEINEFTKQFLPFSDFNFTSLFAWNTDGSTEVSMLNGSLVVRMPNYLDGHPTYSLLGDQQIDSSIETLLKITTDIELVPEVTINSIQQPENYTISEDRDNFDYIYNLTHLSELPGGNFKKKRNRLNVFVKAHGGLELKVRNSHTLSPSEAERIRAIDKEWAVRTPRSKGDIVPERKALDNLLSNFADFKLRLIEVIVDGKTKAFSINEILPNDYAICHFEKALLAHHEHIYTFLTREVAATLKQAGCRWVNWEQDLGLEGLRRSKLSYQPTSMLKKYTLRARGAVN